MSVSETEIIYINESPAKVMNLDVHADDATFKIKTEKLGPLSKDQLLVKNLYFSNDPSQRAWIQKGVPERAMYTTPIRQGDNMKTIGLSQIVESKADGFSKGEIICCSCNWSTHSVISKREVFNKVPLKGLPLNSYLDFLGLTGLTAYFGITEVVKVKPTDTIVVSAAAGATGSMVVQIAKHVIGCERVIGIAGGPEKCEYVKSIGADECVDYKDPNLFANMAKALGERGECDVFFDGVGGKILDMMIYFSKLHGDIIACGSISGYNDTKESAVNSWGMVTTRRLTVHGFIVIDYFNRTQEAVENLLKYYQEGKIKTSEKSITLIDISKEEKPLEQVPKVFSYLFNGNKQNGKLITKLADPFESRL